MADVEKNVKASFNEQQYAKCVDLIVQSRRVLESPKAEPFLVLRPLKQRMENALTALRDNLDMELKVVLARPQFVPAHYEALLRGYNSLDKEGVYEKTPEMSPSAAAVPLQRAGSSELMSPLPVQGAGNDEDTPFSPFSLAAGAVGNIANLPAKLKSTLMSAMKSKTKQAVMELLLALEDSNDIDQDSLSHAVQSSLAAASSGPDQHTASVHLSPELLTSKRTEYLHQIRFKDLCARVPERFIVQATSGVCHALVQAMHTHYLIMQVRAGVACPFSGVVAVAVVALLLLLPLPLPPCC